MWCQNPIVGAEEFGCTIKFKYVCNNMQGIGVMNQRVFLASAIVVFMLVGGAMGGNWTGAVSTSWHDSGNWSNGLPPAAGENWEINASITYKLTVTDEFIGGARTGRLIARNGFTIQAGGSMYVGQLQQVTGTTLIQGTLDSAPGGDTATWWRPCTFTIDGGIMRVNRRMEWGNDTTSGTITFNVINGGVLEQMGTEYMITGDNSGTVTNINISGPGSRVISYDGGSTTYRTWINRYNTSGRVTITNGGSWNMHITMADVSSSQRGLTYMLNNGWVRTTVPGEQLVPTPNGNRIEVVAMVPTWASQPSPEDGSSSWTYSPLLSWTPGPAALRSEVYFGTNQTTVATAQRPKADINADGIIDIYDVNEVVWQWLSAPVFPCPDLSDDNSVNFIDYATVAGEYGNAVSLPFIGSTTGNTFDAGVMLPNTTYYWRVDSMNCDEIVPGIVWSFSTTSAKAGSPNPANNSTTATYNESTKVPLSWAKGFEGNTYEVYFGTSAGSLSLVGTTTSNSMLSPAGIQQNTQYWWRVDTVTGDGTVTGDLWTFKTLVYAFPTAEGFGRWSRGGRGGTVYHVTNLNDSGSGSLRNAAGMSNVTIVFDVGGYINISSKLGFTGSKVTVAGQTAPGGIGVRGAGVSIGADDIIIRHMRFRPGKATSAADALNVNKEASNVMEDHLSIQFSTDENNSMDQPLNSTVQWTFNGWGLETHSCGALLYARDTTVHHTLWAHNHTRNPKARFGLLDWVNNIVFDWDIPFICADADTDVHWANVVNGYFISGASGQSKAFTSAQLDKYTGLPTFKMHLSNTLTDFDTDGVLDGSDKGYYVVSGTVEQRATPYVAPPVGTDSPVLAYKKVLSQGGATPWERDEVDTLLVSDVKNQTRRIIARESDLPISGSGFGTLGGGILPTDTDNDAMPDYWEMAMGLSTTVTDNNGDINGNGYTNLEEYLNWLAVPHAQVTAGAYVDVDLRLFTAGFGASATYSIAGTTGGSASILGDGYTARFTPTAASGMTSFSYTVNDGSSWTDTVQVAVVPAAVVTPDPMTWAVEPAATSVQSITMTATTASAPLGVDYYFTCIAGGGHDSGWQTSTVYTDTYLMPATSYTYTVKARDKGNYSNETDPSVARGATTWSLPSLPTPNAYWMLNETSGATAADSAGSNTGTVLGAAAWTAGKYDNCLSFSATGQSLYVPSSSSIDFSSGSFSVSMWAKQPVSYSGQYELFIKGTIGSGSFPGSGKRYELYRKDTNFRFAIDDNVTKTEISVPTDGICTGDWVHIVAIRDTAADQIKLYVNGQPVTSLSDNTGDISQSEPLYMGYEMFPGAIDDVRIYGSALTADQVYSVYLGN